MIKIKIETVTNLLVRLTFLFVGLTCGVSMVQQGVFEADKFMNVTAPLAILFLILGFVSAIFDTEDRR